MKVSVLIITYNHERFIAQAVESALMQQTDFDYEIVIGEDCSTDGTREIVRELHRRHPDKIRLLLPEKNLGVARNFAQTLDACHGEYVALLEGDDYWTSPDKLQKQVEFLDSHPQCATCSHRVTIVHDDEQNRPDTVYPSFVKEISTLEDLFKQEIVPTPSIMFRNKLFTEFPQWVFASYMVDFPLHVLNTQHGAIGHLMDIMAVYRVHSGGVYSGQSAIRNQEASVKLYEYINEHLNYKLKKVIDRRILECSYTLAAIYTDIGDPTKARAHAAKCLSYRPFFSYLPLKLKVLLRLHAPFLFRLLKRASLLSVARRTRNAKVS
ncbi:MAG TPA: glycosyltransferase [Chloroflexia bacterium]|nr:glycosyltransferase [Chloroflexia bacterium]